MAKSPSKDKLKEWEKTLVSIQTKHGDGIIMDMGKQVGKAFPCIPTGIWDVDNNVLGIGGIPKGRIVEVYGAPGGGKSTLALSLISSVQDVGGLCAYIDLENALDPTWATLNGVDMNRLAVSQPDYGEQALEIVDDIVRSELADLIVVDSVAALVPKKELEGDMGDANVGLVARLMSQAMRKLTTISAKAGTTVLFINQTRDNIGVTYGSPTTTTGGKALKFYASVRLDVARIASIEKGEEIVGNKVKIKAVKNRMAAPFRETVVDLLFAEGFDKLGGLVTHGLAQGIFVKSGSWYSHGEEKIGQGFDSARQYLATRPELQEEIKEKLKQ